MQQGMLYHCVQGAPGVDVQQVICELAEEINPARFEQAWRETIERHAVLRTSFEWEGRDQPRQVVQPMSRVRLDFRYSEFGSEIEARHGIEEYLEADRREGFPSLRAPLLRVALLRGAERRMWFVTTYHHLVIDARSMTLMFREALDRHDALMKGESLELPATRPYRHYIEWLQTLEWGGAEMFWRRHLKGFAAPTPLPLARSAGEVADAAARESIACGELMFRLPAATTERLKLTAGRHGVTVNTMVQAAWSLVLSRYSGEEDVVFGALRACRHIPVEGVDQMLGLFINTVPVRSRISDDVTVADWLESLRDDWVAMRAFEHTPLTRVQQWSEVTPGRPLFDTLVNYQEPSWDAALNALDGRWAERRFDIRSRPGYPLAIDVYGGPTLTTKAFYERERYDDAAVAQILAHFRTALEVLATDALANVAELSIVTRAERERMLVGWNRTRLEYPRDRCVHTFVEERAEMAPEAIAVTDAMNALTYGELNARANRLAHRLKSLGVGPDMLVAVCMERSAEMIVAWVAVLKAGGAFVPLDPGYPRERLAFQIQDCGARVVVTQPRLRAALPTTAGATTIEMQGDGSGFEAEPDRNLPLTSTAKNLAYVIYTSGSTGLPKGVQIEHRALMNLVTWHQELYRVTAADRATHLASPAFDASVWEIWPYLTAGASVHIPDDETRLAPAALWRWMGEKKISVSFMPTPLAEAAMNEPRPEQMALRALLTGGDKLKRRPPANFPCALINHYGPTESTVVATCAVVAKHGPESVAPTIGAPIANTTAYVLDRALRPAPLGATGELFIGGESLARGYLRRPELDAEKFVMVSIAGAPAVRLYRTGDLVRWTAKGELEFLGRTDGQVKIRGCRIELGEVEATVQSHPAVREGLVVTQVDARGQAQLVAYMIPRVAGELRERSVTNEALTEDVMRFLRAKLPAYMVPSAMVALEAWPLTPNGKIDRRALPAPRTGESGGSREQPRTAMEIIVAKVWGDVLGRESVALEDNFFDLGGHSLLAAQVISRLNAALPAPVSVRILFDQPTLGAFARELDERAESNAAGGPRLQRVKRRIPRAEPELVQSK